MPTANTASAGTRPRPAGDDVEGRRRAAGEHRGDQQGLEGPAGSLVRAEDRGAREQDHGRQQDHDKERIGPVHEACERHEDHRDEHELAAGQR